MWQANVLQERNAVENVYRWACGYFLLHICMHCTLSRECFHYCVILNRAAVIAMGDRHETS